VPRHFASLFDHRIRGVFKKALSITVSRPGLALHFLKAIFYQIRAAHRRKYQAACGIQAPALAIISVTRKCNLRCAGCYSKHLHSDLSAVMAPELFDKTLAGLRRMGTGIIMIAGGEPLTHPDVFDVTAKYPDLTFPVFTNGMLIDDSYLALFRRQRQLIPTISIEGSERETDLRRGEGVFEKFLAIGDRMRDLFWGVSFTVTRENYELTTSRKFLRRLLNRGCRLFLFVEYVPVAEDTKDLVLTDEQKLALHPLTDRLTRELPGLFIVFPGDESQYGGCLSAGRGFLHIAPNGAVEPCPFAPHSDRNLNDCTMEEALASPLLKRLQAMPEEMSETEGGCALWARKDEIFGTKE
jgi:MoaA/NifB/PqqE/SkfB family radical SAM enzyme